MLSFLRRLPTKLRSSVVVISAPKYGTNRYVSTSETLYKVVSGRVKYNSFINLGNTRKMGTKSKNMSTLRNQTDPNAIRTLVSQDERRDFNAVFPDIVRESVELTSQYILPDTAVWFTRSLEYNLPKGKHNRGLLTVLTFRSLVRHQELTPENIRLAQILGWCVEMLNAYLLVSDDVMDNSTTRRGQTCWHKLEGVGLTAVNDAIMMEKVLYALLKKYFRNKDYYLDLLELFHESTLITACGQNMDLLNAQKAVSDFTMEMYNATVANKTAHYTFFLPFALAMHMAGIKDVEAFRQSKAILLEIGKFFQVQDDFIDCFGDPKITGKIGSDIQDNKCSWLAVVCMRRANDAQKQIMMDCYGHDDLSKVQSVKELYTTLDLQNIYTTYEEESYNIIKSLIREMSCSVPHGIFLQILNRIYKRDL